MLFLLFFDGLMISYCRN